MTVSPWKSGGRNEVWDNAGHAGRTRRDVPGYRNVLNWGRAGETDGPGYRNVLIGGKAGETDGPGHSNSSVLNGGRAGGTDGPGHRSVLNRGRAGGCRTFPGDCQGPRNHASGRPAIPFRVEVLSAGQKP